MRVLYLGSNCGTSEHRIQALARLGHEVGLIDPRQFLWDSRLIDAWVWRTGGLALSSVVNHKVFQAVASMQYDLVWVDSGELVNRKLVQALRKRIGPVINYNNDDPLGTRDKNRWRNYREAISAYDLIVVMRDINVIEAQNRGAKHVLRVFRSADEVAHAPRVLSAEDRRRWTSEVLFVGTWFPERGPLMLDLIKRGVPISIYGDRWDKAHEWPRLKEFWRGSGLVAADDYAKAIQCAKICLGLVSKGNRDLSTQRSFEIPALGSLLLAERTPEHQALYKEDEEAVFWSEPEECAAKCKALLADDDLRRKTAAAGHARYTASGYTNEQIIGTVLSEISSHIGETSSAEGGLARRAKLESVAVEGFK